MFLLCRTLIVITWMACCTLQLGCAGKQSTQLRVEDLEETTSVIADKLRGSDFLGERNAQSPPIVIAMNKVENLSSDLIPESQQWWMMQRVRSSSPILALSRDKNVRFVIPAQFLKEGKERGNLDEGFAASRAPTHEMSATFLSATRSAGKNRTDIYLCEYRITDLQSGKLDWTEVFEFKRAAVGRGYD